MNANAEMEVGRHLDSGESLLWSGVPRQGVFLRSADVFMIPFSLLWGGFAIFWEITVIAGGAPFFFALFGVPFVLIGLYIIGGRFFVDAKLRANTYYGLTDRRVIIISGLFSTTTNSLLLPTLHDLSVRERKDPTGPITFGRPRPFAAWYAGMQWSGMGQNQAPSFELIENAKQAHDQVVEAQRSAA